MDVRTCAHKERFTEGEKALAGTWQPLANRQLPDSQLDRHAAKWTGRKTNRQPAARCLSLSVIVTAALRLLSAVVKAQPLVQRCTWYSNIAAKGMHLEGHAQGQDGMGASAKTV